MRPESIPLTVIVIMLATLMSFAADESVPGGVKEQNDELPRLRIAEITTQAVDIVFKGYLVEPGGDASKPDKEYWKLTVCWKNGPAKVVPYGSTFHGYKLFPLEKSIQKTWLPAKKIYVEFEIWTLTLSRDGREVVRTQMNQPLKLDEPCVILEFKTDESTWQKTEKLFVDSKLQFHGAEFTILRIDDDSVTIGDSDKNKIVLWI